MTTTNTYQPGDRVRIRASTPFQDSGGMPFDPAVVTFEVKAPDVATVSYVYNAGGAQADEITKLGTGDYACDIDVETPGTWYYYVKGETAGENRGADQDCFEVEAKWT